MLQDISIYATGNSVAGTENASARSSRSIFSMAGAILDIPANEALFLFGLKCAVLRGSTN